MTNQNYDSYERNIQGKKLKHQKRITWN